MNHEYQGEERRTKKRPFTEEEVEAIKQQLLDSIYADIGKNLVKKILWVGGTVCAAALAWLAGKGHITL